MAAKKKMITLKGISNLLVERTELISEFKISATKFY